MLRQILRSMKYKRWKQNANPGTLVGVVLRRHSWTSRGKRILRKMRRIPLFRSTRSNMKKNSFIGDRWNFVTGPTLEWSEEKRRTVFSSSPSTVKIWRWPRSWSRQEPGKLTPQTLSRATTPFSGNTSNTTITTTRPGSRLSKTSPPKSSTSKWKEFHTAPASARSAWREKPPSCRTDARSAWPTGTTTIKLPWVASAWSVLRRSTQPRVQLEWAAVNPGPRAQRTTWLSITTSVMSKGGREMSPIIGSILASVTQRTRTLCSY